MQMGLSFLCVLNHISKQFAIVFSGGVCMCWLKKVDVQVYGQHSSLVVSTSVLQYWGPSFESSSGHYLHVLLVPACVSSRYSGFFLYSKDMLQSHPSGSVCWDLIPIFRCVKGAFDAVNFKAHK